VSWFHFCDSEFNQPLKHAKDVCRAIIDAGLGNQIRWYCYCCPLPFDIELAGMMVRAGCAGINFGVDSLADDQLVRLGREHHLGHIWTLVDILKQTRLNFIFDFIAGGPGETPDTVKLTVSRVRQMGVPTAGMSVGVRVYPGTPLGNTISKGFLRNGVKVVEVGDGLDPLVFYCAPALGEDPLATVRNIIGGDPRFLLLSGPSDADSYNYADDETLSKAILDGARGAYWDILAKRRKQ
ncbi:MAG: radical SAM protein, partial [Dehalococcoidia bacterium]|nr:radical SAM protein [Dehalococcoidia bacterium]